MSSDLPRAQHVPGRVRVPSPHSLSSQLPAVYAARGAANAVLTRAEDLEAVPFLYLMIARNIIGKNLLPVF